MSFVGSDKGFFARFKGHLRDEGERDPGGRYFSILLQQVFRECPVALSRALFPNVRVDHFKVAYADTEFCFMPRRRADLAFFSNQDELLGLVEVKEEDQLGPGSGDQASDYLSFVKKQSVRRAPIQFAYVTKHLPSRECQSALEKSKVQPTFYADIYRRLRDYLQSDGQWEQSPVARLFCEYLEEEGVVYKPIEYDDNVLKLLIRLGCNGAGGGSTSDRTTADRLIQAPKLFVDLMSNAEAMGRDFHQNFHERLGNQFLPKFGFYPEWKIAKVHKTFNDEIEKVREHLATDANAKTVSFQKEWSDGGTLYVWSEGRLKRGRSQKAGQPYIYLGYEFRYSRENSKLTKRLYAGLWITSSSQYEGFGSALRSYPDEHAAQKGAQQIIREQLQQASREHPKIRSLRELLMAMKK